MGPLPAVRSKTTELRLKFSRSAQPSAVLKLAVRSLSPKWAVEGLHWRLPAHSKERLEKAVRRALFEPALTISIMLVPSHDTLLKRLTSGARPVAHPDIAVCPHGGDEGPASNEARGKRA
jgi:hypothetical protein